MLFLWVNFLEIDIFLVWCCRRTPVSMSSPAGTVTPIGESIASSFCGSEGGLTPLATSPSGEGGFDGGFLSTTRGPALIQDHLRCVIMHTAWHVNYSLPTCTRLHISHTPLFFTCLLPQVLFLVKSLDLKSWKTWDHLFAEDKSTSDDGLSKHSSAASADAMGFH